MNILQEQIQLRRKRNSWCEIYFYAEKNHSFEYLEDVECQESGFTIDYSFYSKLRKLQKVAIILQYQIAYLSTLGGAYHLCNKPTVAFQIAQRQERVGRILGSSQIIIRALVFQAVNLRLLGFNSESERLFGRIKMMPELSEDLRKFMEACELWVVRNTPPSQVELIS